MKELSVHFDKGFFPDDNDLPSSDLFDRFNNQIELSWCFPEIVPQIAVPDVPVPHRSFSTQHIDGSTWGEILLDPYVSDTVHMSIAREAARQCLYIFENSGVIIGDRFKENIMLSQAAEKTNVHIFGTYYKLWQVDMELVYDACRNKDAVLPKARLANRSGRMRIKDKNRTRFYLYDCLHGIILNLTDVAMYARTVREVYSTSDKEFERIADFLNVPYSKAAGMIR